MKSFKQHINESGTYRYTWDRVTSRDVKEYAKKNGIKLGIDPKNKDLVYGYKESDGKKTPIFTYDEDGMKLYSDHTIAQFRGGRV